MVTETMEFLPTEGAPITEDIPFPVTVRVSSNKLIVQILTMQIKVETWGAIVEQDLRRMLTIVQADDLYDQVLDFMGKKSAPTGQYVDYSPAAINLIDSTSINTFAGTLEVDTSGTTRHNTLRGVGRRPMRQSMPKHFHELVSANRLTDLEVELRKAHLGLSEGSKLALYPTTGKIAIRSQLRGCNPDEFIKEMAK
jgi:hypothetical protein